MAKRNVDKTEAFSNIGEHFITKPNIHDVVEVQVEAQALNLLYILAC